MSVTPLSTLALDHRFARELPEMAIVWQAEPAPDARLLALDEALAAELGLDASWLRSPDGVGLLIGTTVPAGAVPVAQAFPGTSSVGSARGLVTVGRCCSASWPTPAVTCAICISRVPDVRRSLVVAMA